MSNNCPAVRLLILTHSGAAPVMDSTLGALITILALVYARANFIMACDIHAAGLPEFGQFLN